MKSTLLFLAVAALAGAARGDEPGSERLERAIYLEETVGDLGKAVEFYRVLAADDQAPEAVREQARVRLEKGLAKAGRPAVEPDALAQNDAKAEVPPAAETEASVGAAIQEAVKSIEESFVFPVDRKQLTEATLQALVSNLGAKSEYLSAEQFQEMSRAIDQRLVGIGVQIKLDGGRVVVVAPIPGSPSEKEGMLPGDEIVSIGETKLADVPEEKRLQTATKTIRGPAGEAVSLGVRRGDETKTISIARAPIQLESVRGDIREAGEWQYLLDPEKKIAYVRILQFGAKTSSEVRAVLEKLQAEGAKGLVLDLRENPGGLLNEAVQVCDLFVKEGKIVSVRAKGDREQTIEAKAEGTFEELPLAVLVDRHTGSAAEIVASCLVDHGRAVLVGERTYGQGIVYSILPVKATGGALRLATGVYVRPNGETVYHPENAAADKPSGVTPSAGYEVKWTDEELQKYLAWRQARDIRATPDAAEAKFDDRQLSQALDYVRKQIP